MDSTVFPPRMKRRQQLTWLAAGLTAALVFGCRQVSTPGVEDEAAFFEFHAGGFPASGVADDRGRVLHLEAGQLRRLAPDRWVAIDFEGKSSIWFDNSGRVLARLGYVEI
jgi:hypothetical protein